MNRNWQNIAARTCGLTIVALSGLTIGCVVHDHGGYAQVDVVDVQGYHHQGYYDDQHAWHGGWYDGQRQFHQDPPDWHR